MKRVSMAYTYKLERKLFPYLADQLPNFITPDLLTLAALFCAFLAGLFYFLVPVYRSLLLLINLLIIFHWLFDSLDGQLARTRKIERPRYGHYVDHMLDALSATAILGGLTTSALTLTAAWLWLLIMFLLLIVHVHLATVAFREFQLSLGNLGPTEARIALILVNTFIFIVGNPRLDFIFPATLIDWIGAAGSLVLLVTLLSQVVNTSGQLNCLDQEKSEEL